MLHFLMRASLILALGAGLGLMLWRLNASAAQVDNPDGFSVSSLLPSLSLFSEGDMQISYDGIEQLKAREGFSEYSYPDASGRSIGYGHFIKPGESFAEPIDQATADALLASDMQDTETAVNAYVTIPLTQSQFDALVSLVYNIGTGNFKASTLLSKLNAGDITGAAAEFPRWNKSQGQTLQALVSRRADEQAQFLT